MKENSLKQRGVVSLFIVVFAALLITVVSIGFVGIMIQDQQQASANDLSQSAYDSAQAGVEDAKRALLLYQSICDSDPGACSAAKTKIASPSCNVAVETLDDIKSAISADGEVKIQTNGENALDQAYTCVKVKLDTIDYLGTLSSNEYDMISLNSISSFDTVKIEWFSSLDISSDKNFAVNLLKGIDSTKMPLLAPNDWPSSRPPVVEAQLIQFGSNGFNLDNLGSINNSDTLFLYPSTTGVKSTSFISDVHKNPTGKPKSIICKDNLQSGGYACAVSLILPLPDPVDSGNRIAFLRVGAIYNKTSFRVTLSNISASVNFNGVQPEIDSTGRANDLFRRVKSRVKLIDANFPYPEAAVDVTGNFCKNFTITDNVIDYTNSCTP